MTDDELQQQAWEVCCDFHDDPDDIRAHLTEWELVYGKSPDGTLIEPPPGWKILPFRTVIPHVHREFINGLGWIRPRTCRSTVTPIFAKPSICLAYAVPLADREV